MTKTKNSSTFIPMVILTTLFFIFGFVTWLNGPLIPFFKLACELTESQSYFVTFAALHDEYFDNYPQGLILIQTWVCSSLLFNLEYSSWNPSISILFLLSDFPKLKVEIVVVVVWDFWQCICDCVMSESYWWWVLVTLNVNQLSVPILKS